MDKWSHCKLCSSKANWFCESRGVVFYKCSQCLSLFKATSAYIDPLSEKLRYQSHNNDVNDLGYQKFVSPISLSVQKEFNPDNLGLDYGCGTGPVITHLLTKEGYNVILYDPFFYPDRDYTKSKYDFIICCEVMEHFHDPAKEFSHLKKLLNKNGRLYCKTKMISDDVGIEEFQNWYYKNDPTHVFFYSPSSLNFIKKSMDFSALEFDEKLITFIA